MKAKQVACPTCKKPAEYSPANEHRPFCSERCRLLDLGEWASDKYRVPGEKADLSVESQKDGSEDQNG